MSSMQTTPRLPKQRSELFVHLEQYNQKQQLRHLRMQSRFKKEQQRLEGVIFPTSAKKTNETNLAFTNELIKGGIEHHERVEQVLAENVRADASKTISSDYNQPDFFKLRRRSTNMSPATRTLKPIEQPSRAFNARKHSFATMDQRTPKKGFVNEFVSSAIEPAHAIRWVARKTATRLQAQEMEIERIEKKIMAEEALKREQYMQDVLGKARRGEFIPEDQLIKAPRHSSSLSEAQQTPQSRFSKLEQLLSNCNIIVETNEKQPEAKKINTNQQASQEALITTQAGSPPVHTSPPPEQAAAGTQMNVVATDSVRDSVQRSPFDPSVQIAEDASREDQHGDTEFLEQQYQTELKLFEAEASIQQVEEDLISPTQVPFHQTHKQEHATLPVSPARHMSTNPSRVAVGYGDLKAQTGSAAQFASQQQTKTRFVNASKSNRQSSQRTVQSLLQRPNFQPEKDMPKMLDQYVTNFAGHLHEQFKKQMPLSKFKRALAREVSAGSFARGQEKMAQWTQKFDYKHRNKIYYHLQTIDKWKEEDDRKERERLAAEKREQDSAMSPDYPPTTLKNQIMGKLGQRVMELNQHASKEARKEERAVRKKLQRGEKLTYDELTARAVAIQLPGINQRYLMNNQTCREYKKFNRQDALMQLKATKKDNSKSKRRVMERSGSAEGSSTSMLGTDSEVDEEVAFGVTKMQQKDIQQDPLKQIADYEEWIERTYEETKSEEERPKGKEGRLSSPSTDVEIKRMITMAIYYEGAEFKALIQQAHLTLRTFKSKKMLEADDAAEKRRQQTIMRRVYIRFMQRLMLQRKLFDYDFLKKRYGQLSPAAKHVKREKDNARYGAPVLVEPPNPEDVKHFLKLKLAPMIAKELFELATDPVQRVSGALSPLKAGKVDKFVHRIIKDLQADSEDGRVAQAISRYRKMNRTKSLMRENVLRPEYQQLLHNTKNANYKLTGKEAPSLYIMKDAQADFDFLEKLKKKMTLNSQMFIHEVGLEEDPEVKMLREEQAFDSVRASQAGAAESEAGGSAGSPSRLTQIGAESRGASAAPTPGLAPRRKPSKKTAAEKAKPDIEMFFAQTCLDGKFTPVLKVLRKIMDKTQKNNLVVDIHDFKLNPGWAKIIHEVIADEKDFKYMVRKLLLTNNRLSSDSFSLILKALQAQEGLESIVYQSNQINEECVEQLEDFLANKNLEHLNVKSLVDTDEATVAALFSAVYCGSNLQRLELINIKHMNLPEPFSALMGSLAKLPDLKHLNLASNFLDQRQLADVVETMANTRLVTLNLSDNVMKPIWEAGRKISRRLSKPCRRFYQGISFVLEAGNVQCLDLSQMQLGDEAINRLCPALIKNASLTSLHLSNNGISKEAVADLRWKLSIVHKEGEPTFSDAGPDRDSGHDMSDMSRSLSPMRHQASPSVLAKTAGALPEIAEEKAETAARESSVRTSQVAEEIPRLENPYLPAKRVVSLDRPYSGGELPPEIQRDISASKLASPLPPSVATERDPAKGVRQIRSALYRDFSMNLVNHYDKLEQRRVEKNTFGMHTPAGVRTRLLEDGELLGGRLVLSRLLGHLEFEAVSKPMYSEARIERARFRLAEAERHKIEMDKYGGIIVDGKIVQPKPRPQSVDTDENEESLSQFVSENQTEFDETGMLSFIGSNFEGERDTLDELRQIKEARYNMPPLHMRWRIVNECHLCNRARYCLLFYQRSKANIWFRELSAEDPSDGRLISSIPSDALAEYRRKLAILNQALQYPEYNLNKQFPILDPLICGNFAVMKVKEFKNPHEYAESLIRQELIDEVTKSLAWKKTDIFSKIKKQEKALREYKKHFMVRYGDRRRAAIEGQRWLQVIMKNLKYQYNTTFLNCPNALDLDENEEKELDKVVKESNLFVGSFFLHSGRQQVVVLDCEYDPRQNAFVETYYTREYLVPQMVEDPARPSADEEQFMTDQMQRLGIYDKYEAIAAQNEADEKKRQAEEKARRKELQRLKEKEEEEKAAKLAAKKKAAKEKAAAGN